jgi:LAGLIDADG DNA endonuclease family protein
MAGFITGEGCFFIKVNKNRNKAGVGVQLVFQVSQHIRAFARGHTARGIRNY